MKTVFAVILSLFFTYAAHGAIEVWSVAGSSIIRRFDTSGNVLGDIATANARAPITQVGNQVWSPIIPTGTTFSLSNFYTDGIRRYDLAGNILPDINFGFQFSSAMTVVGDEVWATKQPTGTGIVRFNFDGSMKGEYATSSDPYTWLTVVGDEVWNYEWPNSSVRRFGKGGDFLGSFNVPWPASSSFTVLTVVGDEVWTNWGSRFSRLDFQGNVLSSTFPGSNVNYTVVGNEVWIRGGANNQIDRFDFGHNMIGNYPATGLSYLMTTVNTPEPCLSLLLLAPLFARRRIIP